MKDQINVLIVGCGNMGASHAKAYHELNEFNIVGLVARGKSKAALNQALGGNYPLFDDFDTALNTTSPDAVCISTYPDTHESYAIKALTKGCHVFIEKPLADTVEGARRVAATAKAVNKKLVVGYILRHHPSWQQFIKIGQTLGKPLVMRMNLNQQSQGDQWEVHQNLLQSLSPIVDCGVHYIDVMCQLTNSKPISVSAIGARLSAQIPDGQYNYGQLQIRFEDQSIGWYEAGWGPMMSETAFFVKDIVGPHGSVSIVAKEAGKSGKSDSIAAHTQTESLLVHHAALNADSQFSRADEWVDLTDEPDHQDLCTREQLYFLRSIKEDLDLTSHINDAVTSLQIALAADESVKTGKTIFL